MEHDAPHPSGIVEMDECYIGGKTRKNNRRDDDPKGGDKSKRGRGTDKAPVIGVIERGGKVKAMPTDKSEMTAEALAAFIRASVDCFKHRRIRRL